MRALRHRVADGPAWPLSTWLLLVLLLRLPGVLCADGFVFVDHQYQYVDPAWHLATGQAWHETWEWIDGARSWVYPGFLAGVFRALLWFGIDDPMWLMRGARGVHALVSLLPAWLFWLVVVRWNGLAAPRLPLLLFAGSGLLVTTGVQASGPALGATLAVAAALAVHGPRWFPLLGGVCLGLAFCCRVQEALFGPALLGVLCWQRRFRPALAFAVGCLPGIALQGFVDLASHGRFLGSVWSYVETNLVLGSATKWRAQPWWFYFVFGVLPVVLLVPPWLRLGWQRLVQGSRLLPGVAAAAVLHLAVHSCIARKALRFEYAALAMLLAVVAVGIAAAGRAAPGTVDAWHRRGLAVLHGVLFLGASFWFGNAGAVRMANALRSDPGLRGEILVVEHDATSLGGFFYLRADADRTTRVPQAELLQRLRERPPAPGGLVIAIREPLDLATLAAVCPLEPVGAFTGMFDLRTGDRRFVYRRR